MVLNLFIISLEFSWRALSLGAILASSPHSCGFRSVSSIYIITWSYILHLPILYFFAPYVASFHCLFYPSFLSGSTIDSCEPVPTAINIGLLSTTSFFENSVTTVWDETFMKALRTPRARYICCAGSGTCTCFCQKDTFIRYSDFCWFLFGRNSDLYCHMQGCMLVLLMYRWFTRRCQYPFRLSTCSQHSHRWQSLRYYLVSNWTYTPKAFVDIRRTKKETYCQVLKDFEPSWSLPPGPGIGPQPDP